MHAFVLPCLMSMAAPDTVATRPSTHPSTCDMASSQKPLFMLLLLLLLAGARAQNCTAAWDKLAPIVSYTYTFCE